jgi:hypothetical protein
MTPIPLSPSSSASSASAKTAIAAPRRAAQGYADHLNSVLNRTVSDSRLSLIQRPEDPNAFELTRFVEGSPAPLDLHGTLARLFTRQLFEVVDGHCRVESYSYRLQAGNERESWLIRWEYYREPPRADYPYPLAHVHFNGALVDGSEAARLHVPTRRIPLELVIWHLVAEWGVQPRGDEWRGVLEESICWGSMRGAERSNTSRC